MTYQPKPVWWWIHVGFDGRTDQAIEYTHREQRGKQQKREGGCMFTTKRTRKRFYRVGKVHQALAVEGRSYFVTHGMPPEYDNEQRRQHFRKWLDRLRKMPGYRGHQWVTEYHDSERTSPELRGKIHHHAVVRFAQRWNYESGVVRWSERYCKSPNGLDIQAVRTGHTGAYMAKALGYLNKANGTAAELPFRWWGTSRIIRTVRCHALDVPLFTSDLAITRHGVATDYRKYNCSRRYAVTLPYVATMKCAARTRQEEIRAQRRKAMMRINDKRGPRVRAKKRLNEYV